jgi:hypothetical protein
LSPGHPFYDAATDLIEMALDANDKGDYFPVSFTLEPVRPETV